MEIWKTIVAAAALLGMGALAATQPAVVVAENHEEPHISDPAGDAGESGNLDLLDGLIMEGTAALSLRIGLGDASLNPTIANGELIAAWDFGLTVENDGDQSSRHHVVARALVCLFSDQEFVTPVPKPPSLAPIYGTTYYFGATDRLDQSPTLSRVTDGSVNASIDDVAITISVEYEAIKDATDDFAVNLTSGGLVFDQWAETWTHDGDPVPCSVGISRLAPVDHAASSRPFQMSWQGGGGVGASPGPSTPTDTPSTTATFSSNSSPTTHVPHEPSSTQTSVTNETNAPPGPTSNASALALDDTTVRNVGEPESLPWTSAAPLVLILAAASVLIRGRSRGRT